MDKQFEELVDFRSGDARPGWAKDGLTNRTTVHLDWKDRVKLLFGWRLEVETYTATENVIGQSETRGCIRVFNPRKVSRMIGVCESHTRQPQICTREHVCGVEGPCNGFPRKPDIPVFMGWDKAELGGDRTVYTQHDPETCSGWEGPGFPCCQCRPEFYEEAERHKDLSGRD